MTGSPDRRGLLVLLSSPSGAGKSTLARMLLKKHDTMRFSVSATTRAARKGEVDGKDYFFKSREEFMDAVKAGEMLEHAEVFGNLYGTPKPAVIGALSQGLDVIFDVDWQGGQQIRNSELRDVLVTVFILPPSIAALEARLRSRGQDSDEVVASRMAKSMSEISHWAEYDYVLVNDDLGLCFEKLEAILAGERLRRGCQPELVDFVRGLNSEFEAST